MIHDFFIAGVKIAMDTFFHLKESKSSKTIAELTVNRVMFAHDSIALNISIINKTDKPFSIINMFMKQQQQQEMLEACRVNSFNLHRTSHYITGIDFTADMFTCNIKKPDGYFNLNAFNIHAYLLENQAETGWIVFKIKPEKAMFSSFCIKLSGSDEILYSSN